MIVGIRGRGRDAARGNLYPTEQDLQVSRSRRDFAFTSTP